MTEAEAVRSTTHRRWPAHRKTVVWLMVAAAGLRLALFAIGPMHDPSRARFNDSQRFQSLAHNLVETGAQVERGRQHH